MEWWGVPPREDTEGSMRPKQFTASVPREKKQVPPKNLLDTRPVHHQPLKETCLLRHLSYFAKSLSPLRLVRGITLAPWLSASVGQGSG